MFFLCLILYFDYTPYLSYNLSIAPAFDMLYHTKIKAKPENSKEKDFKGVVSINDRFGN